MPTAPVDDEGTVLYYEDSGVPAGSTKYVTLVLIHGTCFHSAIYRPMISFASQRKLRLVLLNLRDYPGSTPLTAVDIADLRDLGEEGQARAMQKRGLEIAAFLRWFIETENIPPAQEHAGQGELAGGLSLLSWSGGNCPTVAMLAHADKLPEETRKLFETHLRSIIMHDPSGTVIGQPRPPGLSALKRNPSAPVDVQVAEFAAAVASYYPPFTFPESVNPPPTFDPPRRALHFISPDGVDTKHTPTTSRMTPEVLRSLTHPPVMAENQHLIWTLSHDVYRTNLTRALYDCCMQPVEHDDSSGKGPVMQAEKQVWPALRVHVIWCEMTVGDCAWAAAIIHAQYEAARIECRRRVRFHMVAGANHFVHWEEPERFVELLASIA
ncbi:hypothetical protein BC628DRAFT_1330448 [Trametes gibbosa]|nr:hypothetical protein BC628DRAFT_1330448 [Trametes gibbosa]